MAVKNPTKSRAATRAALIHTDPAVWRRVKVIAAENDTTISSIVSEALTSVLAKHARRAPAAD